ncbi:MAG: dihydroorotase [Henriciella sp.]|jgi:dihydroorotase|uniref:dihydroorotase n=1 Tax=Henriciella sp. TaxID=1968823 RepID=UPI000C0D4C7A|nr:dihydroorotase [Henriciella sp.]MAN73106.1 dihydroorotase [Henriciella sp.]MBF35379.1 dihydroorotase [Hyphomonadaceae bacterium]MBK75517.1 dihydroorotase [Henriciella sp.]PHR79325.1 MAG: dihydroorotase [Henriciella sp.]|tara:strand:- start:8845 stop:10116 length:1272 start_codon:yes stop_codon:yes gene_type:complete
MSRTLITNARLLCPAAGLDEPGSLLIENGEIATIGDVSGAAETTIDAQGLCLAPGLIDLRVKTGEPGAEQRETLETASRAAVSGGVTTMVVMPDTNPVIDDVALVQFIANRGRETSKTRVYPAAALTMGLKGEAMSEIGLMQGSGAVFFTNGDWPVADTSVLRRTMAYAASCDVMVASRADTHALSARGVMNSGARAARMGLTGLPREAEWIGLARDLLLAEATGCRLLVDQVSTGRSLDMIRDARERGVEVYVSVAAHHLFFNETDVGDYLTYCKVNPPFRSEEDRQALIEGLAAGEIDAVVSAHDPQPPEEKRLPFGEAAFGAAGLETVLSALLALVQDERLGLLDALRSVTAAPASLIGVPQGRLAAGLPADLILFDPEKPWFCERENLLSRSVNSPFDGRRMVGRVMHTLVGGETVFQR